MVSSVSVGMVVAGRYTLERCINRGGLGSLWLVRDEQSDSYCGLRLAESAGQGIVELAARFLAEVDVVGRIRCENVVDVLDYGEWNGLPFLVVEHVEGDSLSVLLVHRSSMQPKTAYRIIAQTARALARAHAAGIVHGDLTPEHILITSDGMQPMAKVFNFGLSQRGAQVGVTNMTRVGSFLHLPHYASPEQVSNRTTDWRSDLWSLAIICYECLIGHKPFETSNFAELLTLITSDPIAPIMLPGGRTPSALQSWWEKATARDPDARFQSAKEMADALGKAFGFPLVFVPEATSVTLGPQASPASLPIVLRDSTLPSSSRPPPRVPTPNPKLKAYPSPFSTGRPMQVAVRSSSPAPTESVSQSFRHSTEIGLGAASPPNVLPKSRVTGISDGAEESVGRFDDAGAPPSSLKVDVDVVPPSAEPEMQRGHALRSEAVDALQDDEDLVNGFPLSEAPTVARKLPPEPTRRVILKGASSDEPLTVPSVPPRRRHTAAWFTAAAIVIAGTIGAARLVRVDRFAASAGRKPAASSAVPVASAGRIDVAQSSDAGPHPTAMVSDPDESPLAAAQLEEKRAQELARATAAVDGAVPVATRKHIGERVPPKPAVAQPAQVPATKPETPTEPMATPSSEADKRNDGTPDKHSESKSMPANSTGSDYGI